MLCLLEIKNYALIAEASIAFGPGLTIISGETGAGKSILLGALGLVLGNRADGAALARAQEKCVVEATFKLNSESMKPLFDELGFDFAVHTIIRREILPGGRSRCFVNDMPVNASDVKSLAAKLLDIHGQHHNLLLHTRGFLLQVLDTLGDLLPLRAKYEQTFAAWKKKSVEYAQAKTAYDTLKAEEDYLRFQVDELNTLNWKEGEFVQLEKQWQLASHSEKITEWASEATTILQAEQFGVLDTLARLKVLANKLDAIVQSQSPFSERVHSALEELKDLNALFEDLNGISGVNPQTKLEMQERLDRFYSLCRKHRVNTEEELLLKSQEMETTLLGIENQEGELLHLANQLNELNVLLENSAMELSEARKTKLSTMASHILPSLEKLGMKGARMFFELTPSDTFLSDGKEILHCLFSANPGIPPGEISKIASGGEISRLMLVLKRELAGKLQFPTVLFDEIDTGVSGPVADSMGELLEELSTNIQTIVITHLPQIACKGPTHFVVSKEVDRDSAQTYIRLCDNKQRVNEIARMLSGAEVSQSALENARNLLQLK